MKEAFFSALAAALILILISALRQGGTVPASAAGEFPAPAVTVAADSAPDTLSRSESTPPGSSFDESLLLQVLDGDSLRTMDLHTYLTGVLLAEMPADFELEARKAQAVACRTYALRRLDHPKHDPAAVCTDSACCQLWRDPDTADPADRQRAEAAVAATDGLVLRYRGQLIEATFFSCSGGRTEAAAAVWGNDLPYLQPVDSPGEEEAAHFTDEVRISLEEFRDRLQAADPEVCFPEALGAWVGAVTTTPGGGVDAMELGGRVFSGVTLRRLFGLRSTAFTLTLTAEDAVFETRGFGHRVGMSQWGAQAMALAGADYAGILTHYYTGVTVEPYSR